MQPLTKKEIRVDMQQACAVIHPEKITANMPLLTLCEIVLDHGLPARAERERLLAERLGDDTAED